MFKTMEKVDMIEKNEYKLRIDELEARLGGLQRKCREFKIPILILMDGLEVAGKGIQIGKLMKALDPRGFRVYSITDESQEEKAHPFLWRFWNKIPGNGEIVILDGSWYRKVTIDLFDEKIISQNILECYDEIRSFEQQLVDSGMCLVKFFLYIDEHEQKKRMKKLEEDKSTSWRVTKDDWKKNKKFTAYKALVNDVLTATHSKIAPWKVVNAVDRRTATIHLYEYLIQAIETQIKSVRMEAIHKEHKEYKETKQLVEQQLVIEQLAVEDENQNGKILDTIDLDKVLSDEEYDIKLEKLQKKIQKLHGELYRQKIPMVIGFEGWDAGGKGGAIRRLTEKMDSRGYVVFPIQAPSTIEKNHHYLWRFWKNMPKDGHITIFDRTWYGRVMVERIEGFCSEEEWKRAYKEINDMEQSLYNAGAIVIKFWLQIDKGEQKARFEARQADPEKQWKITDEDWRNREKWEAYEMAVNEMIAKTSTQHAPWVIVEGNDKKYARIKVLETVIQAMETRLK